MNPLQVIIELLKRGTGARDAKTEIDQVKESAEQADSSAGSLRTQMGGLTSVLRGLSYVLSGAQQGIRGVALAIGGMFQMIVAHPIGRLVAALVTLGVTLYAVISRFRETKESLEDTKAKADIAAKALEKIAALNLENLKKSVSDLNDRLAQTLAKTNEALEALKAMRDAELAVETARISKAVAAGEITTEEGERRKLILKKESDAAQRATEQTTLKQQRAEIEAVDRQNRERLQALTKEKERREIQFGKTSRVALSTGAITPEELAAGDFSKAKERAEEEKKKAESELFRQQLLGPKGRKLPEYQAKVETARENLIAIERLERQQRLKEQASEQYKAVASELEKEIAQNDQLIRSKSVRLNVLESEEKSAELEYQAAVQSVNTRETQRKKTEELKLKRETLEREYQKAQEAHNVAKARQLSRILTEIEIMEYETSILGTKVEPEMQEAQETNIQERRAREWEKFTAEEDKKAIEKRAELALQQQRAEEQVAGIHLREAERAAGAKGQTPRERKASAEALQQAGARYGKEAAEVSQAKALAGKIRETVDPAALANLLRSIEAVGSSITETLNDAAGAFNNLNTQIKQQSSQLKNGGLRTK